MAQNIWRSDPRLAKGTLAKLWDDQSSLRQRMNDKEFPYLSRWLWNQRNEQYAIGVPSVKAMGMNALVLEKLAEWYCPCQPFPKALPIQILRREAGLLKEHVLWLGLSIASALKNP